MRNKRWINRLAVPGAVILLLVGGLFWWDSRWYPVPFDLPVDPFAELGFTWDRGSIGSNLSQWQLTLRAKKRARLTNGFVKRIQSSDTYWRDGGQALLIRANGNIEFRKKPGLKESPYEKFDRVSFETWEGYIGIWAKFSGGEDFDRVEFYATSSDSAEFSPIDPFVPSPFPNFEFDPTSEFFDSLPERSPAPKATTEN